LFFLAATPDNLNELFRKVAADDPEWFKEFVVETLNEDLPEDVVGLQLTEPQNTKKVVTRTDAGSPEEDLALKRNLGEIYSDDELNIQEMTIKEESILKGTLDAMAKDDELTISLAEGVENDFRMENVTLAVNANNKTVDLINVVDSNGAQEQEKSEIESASDNSTEADKWAASLNSNETDTETILPPSGAIDNSDEEVSASSNAGISLEARKADTDYLESRPILPLPTQNATAQQDNETLFVQFQTPYRNVSEPLSTLVELGYSKEEVSSLDTDALDLILNDRIVRPSIGIPAGWKVKIPVVKIRPAQDDIDSSEDLNVAEDSPKNGLNDKVTKRTKANNRKESENWTDDLSLAEVAAADSKNKVALYSDPSGQSWGSVSLADIVKLGYTEKDVVTLDPGALNLIAIERVKKPRTGIPTRWRLLERSRPVKVLGKDQAKKFLEREDQKEKNIRPRRPSRDEKAAFGGRRPRRENSEARNIRDRSPRGAQRQRTRGAPVDDLKTVYDGRSKRKPRLADPPPPGTVFWPDIDSFRNMLRNEASFRLRILGLLGDSWAKPIKDESDWRLDLYKKWLWTLHKGVGEPLIESRSDRMRRKQKDNMQSPKKARRTGTDDDESRRRS
jgi:hypothetical protein